MTDPLAPVSRPVSLAGFRVGTLPPTRADGAPSAPTPPATIESPDPDDDGRTIVEVWAGLLDQCDAWMLRRAARVLTAQV